MGVNMRPRTVQKTKAQKLAQRQLTTATPPLELETAPPDVAGNPPPACDDSAQMTVRYRELKAKLIEFSKTLATTSSSCDTASLRPAQVEGKLATLATMGEAIVHPPLGKDSTIAATFDGPVVGEHPGFDEPIKLWCNVSEYFYTLRYAEHEDGTLAYDQLSYAACSARFRLIGGDDAYRPEICRELLNDLRVWRANLRLKPAGVARKKLDSLDATLVLECATAQRDVVFRGGIAIAVATRCESASASGSECGGDDDDDY